MKNEATKTQTFEEWCEMYYSKRYLLELQTWPQGYSMQQIRAEYERKAGK